MRIKNLREIGYPGYELSDEGEVWSLNYRQTGERRKLRQGSNNSGYLCVNLWNNGKKETWLVHRLVAIVFIGDWSMWFEEINHKDENRKNNNVANLEWCDRKYNIHYGNAIKKMSEANKGKHPTEETRKKLSEAHKGKNAKKINQYTKEGDFVQSFNSLSDAEKLTGVNQANISSCLTGKYKSAGGYIWRYYDIDCCHKLDYKYERITTAKKVNQYTMDGDFIQSFDSITEAYKLTGIKDYNIINCCRGKQKSAGGFIWRYA